MGITQKLRARLDETNRLHSWPRLFNLLLPWVVLVAALGITLHLWHSEKQQLAQRIKLELDHQVNEASHEIESHIAAYRLLLRGMQGLFASSDNVSADEFRHYIDTINPKTRFPGIHALGYIQVVPDERRELHIASMRAQGFPGYEIRPAGPRALTTSAVYVEPATQETSHIIGYDMFTNPVLRSTMERASKQNLVSLSGKLVLPNVASPHAEPDVLMFLPVFQPHSSNDPSPAIAGWVYAQFRADSLAELFSAGTRARLALKLYDGDQVSPEALLASTDPSGKARTMPDMKIIRKLEIGGHVWLLEAHALPALGAGIDRGQPRLILIAGIGSSLLLFLLMQLLIHGRAHALRIAQDMNRALIASEYRWKYALEGAGEGVWDWDIVNDQVYLGPRLHSLLGYDDGDIAPGIEAMKALIHPEDHPAMSQALNTYLAGHTAELATEGRLKCKGGDWKWCLLRGMIVSRDDDGKPTRLIGTLADIAERHQREENLRLWSTVFSNVSEAVVITDVNETILLVNSSFTHITGFTAEEVVGLSARAFGEKPRQQPQLDVMRQTLLDTGHWAGEIMNRRKNGEQYVAWLSASAIRNLQQQITHIIIIFSDISERKADEARMVHLAHYDQLTDLPNRALFNDRLHQALATARRNHAGAALLFIDLDKFKPVNDTFGHEVGDMLLKETAYRLLDCIRESDTAARIGGDEFVVLLPGTESVEDARTVADKILVAIEDPLVLGGHDIRISASIGIAVYPQHGSTDQEILSNADNAMYHAKHTGFKPIFSYDEIPSKRT